MHQTYMEHLLKSRLREADARQHDSSDEEDVAADAAEGPADGKTVKAEECMMCDMDFSENYDITHKVEIQSEHWAHEQVTLYILISHFKNKTSGRWTSEAHVFVSGDRAHDTYFVQHALSGNLFPPVLIRSLLIACKLF